MARSKSSARWLKEHRDDVYVQKAKADGLRSRAAFKLEEIVDATTLIKPGMVVVDLGAAPGGFSQIAAGKVGSRGRVIACDLLPMTPIPRVEFFQGDIRDPVHLEHLLSLLGQQKADLVISDMAPNLSGIADVDQARAVELAEMALETARMALHEGGGFLVKLFHGAGFDPFVAGMRTYFRKVAVRKPKASRARSREAYVLATNYKLV